VVVEVNTAGQFDLRRHPYDMLELFQRGELLQRERRLRPALARHVAMANERFAQALAFFIADMPFYFRSRRVGLIQPIVGMHFDLAQLVIALKQAQDLVAYAAADGHAGDKDERAQDDAERGQEGPDLLLKQGPEREAQDVGETHEYFLQRL